MPARRLGIAPCSGGGKLDDAALAVHVRRLGTGGGELTVPARDCAGDISAWLGPAIGPTAFEVGYDVRGVFLDALARTWPTRLRWTGRCALPTA